MESASLKTVRHDPKTNKTIECEVYSLVAPGLTVAGQRETVTTGDPDEVGALLKALEEIGL